MVKNYYKTLSIPTTSSLSEIQEGYKRSVLKWHPKKTKVALEHAATEFSAASEAYEVLSTPRLRSVYDAYGYTVLTSGISTKNEIIFPAYEFKSTPDQVYRKFVLDANPFISVLNSAYTGSMFGCSALGKHWDIDESPSEILLSLECTLEELFFGCRKSVKYTCLVMNPTKTTSHEEVRAKDVLIKPGCSGGMKIVYEGEGSEKMNYPRGDLVVSLVEQKHEKFRREGSDLHVTVTLGLHEAISASSVEVENIDKTILVVSVDHCISPQQEITIEGQGMPVFDTADRGNLCVHYDIVFPERIPEARLEELRALLPH